MTSLWLGSAIFIGFALSAPAAKHAVQYKLVLILVTVVGMTLTVLVYTWADRASKLKQIKYDRCKEIERMLGMCQNLRALRARPYQDRAYTVLFGVLFLAWVALLVYVASL